jgi:hypothetical protein
LRRNVGEKSIWVKKHRMNRDNSSTDFSEVVDYSKGVARFLTGRMGE